MSLTPSTYYHFPRIGSTEAAVPKVRLRARPGELCRVPALRLSERDSPAKAGGKRVNHKRVARIMRGQNPRVRPRSHSVVTMDGDHDRLGPFPNLVEEVAPTGPD